MSSSYRMELDKWLQNLDVRAQSVLDVGGSQLPVNRRVRSWDVYQYKIADLPEPHVDSPKPEIELDLNIPHETVITFDMIFCLEVFDYVYDPMTAFKNLANLLEKGGTLWVTFPFVYPTHQPIEDDALRYTEFGIKRLAERNGLQIEEIIKRRPETNAIEQLWRNERMRAAKNYDHNVTGFIVRMTK